MKMDLSKNKYTTVKEFKEYIYGSADVVGLMCLKVFVQGNQKLYLNLKENAMSLGSAFQKVNFLRDLKVLFCRNYESYLQFHQQILQNHIYYKYLV